MEIRPNENAINLSPASNHGRTVVPATPRPIDEVNLEDSVAVDRALRETPDIRPEVIERAKTLVGDPTYPPQEAIRSLSHLLAMHLPPS